MMKPHPLVTICVPTFNGQRYIRECLSSILSQTFFNFEVLVVDDHSTDLTLNIVKEIAAKDSRFKIIVNSTRLGLRRNHNNCVQLAEGTWIKFVHQDDLIAPNYLEEVMSIAYKNPELKLICSHRHLIFDDSYSEETKKTIADGVNRHSLLSIFPDKTEILAGEFCKAVLDNIGINFVGSPANSIFHQDVFQYFGPFNENLLQWGDYEFSTRVAINTGIFSLPKVLTSARLHQHSVSSEIANKRWYRGHKLDPLIIIHDFVTHKFYEPLRLASRQHIPKISLFKTLCDDAFDCWRMARFAGKDQTESKDHHLLSQWQDVVNSYPSLSRFCALGALHNFTSPWKLISNTKKLFSRI